MVVEFLHGLNQDVVHVAAAMTYTLAILLAALLAKGTATGRQALVRALIAVGIMLAPQLASGVNILLSSPDHIGTSVPVMAVWLILDHARPRWYVPVIAGAFLGWAVVADALVILVGVLPLAGVSAIRVFRAAVTERKPLAAQWYDMALGAAAVLGTRAGVVTQVREIAPVLPFSAALAGRLLGGQALAGRLKPALLVVMLGYLLGLAGEISQPPVAAQNQQLTSWLAARHLHTGLSG